MGVLDVADEHDLEIWRALGSILLGAAKTGLGRAEEGLAEINEGVAQYQGLRTPPVFWPLLLYVRAGAYLRVGRPDVGLHCIDEAIEIGGQDGHLRPVFFLQKGELLLATDEGAAEAWFQRAFDVASELDERMPQLRAAIGLCRAQRKDARDLLSATYETFTEGFETPDLTEARQLLG